MLSFKEFFYLREGLTAEREVELSVNFGSEQIQTRIIRNPAASGRKRLVEDNTSGLNSGELGFIIHVPSGNVYFFNRDLMLHRQAGRRLGMGITRGKYDDKIDETITGYFDTKVLDPRISISEMTTDIDWLKNNKINVLEVVKKSFMEKCLISLSEAELDKVIEAFKYYDWSEDKGWGK